MRRNGYTLIEILVVITIFIMLAVLVTQSILISIKSSRKSLAIARVRENLSQAKNVFERNMKNAIDVPISSCSNSEITYIDADNVVNTFTCQDQTLIWNSTTNVTGDDITLTTCSFACDLAQVPKTVIMNLVGTDLAGSGIEGETISISSMVVLRNE
jgi:prepilin-type N-terminal cleavage/methylation domain-containing protein